MKQDYYSILGIAKSADAGTIKKAYRKLAKKYHPDTHAGDKTAEEKFKEITEAYEVLSDPKKKKLYDQFGYAAFDGSMGADPESAYQNAYQEFHFNGNDIHMEDLFGDLFGHGESTMGKRNRADHSDVTAAIEIDFEDAVFGADRKLQIQDSSGGLRTLEVHIPAGIDTGKKIRLKGKGNPRPDGTAGDLYLEVTLRRKEGYERKGNDVYTTAQIPFTTAVFGGEAIVPTLYGNVKCRIPEGAQSGSKIRLRGKGMPIMKQPSQKGDEYVTIQIQVPKHLNDEARKKLQEYETASRRASLKLQNQVYIFIDAFCPGMI